MPDALAARSVRLAESVFGQNLILAFVGGSRAKGTHSNKSDIDTFLLITEEDRTREFTFARSFRELHASAGLDFDHYGEIFSTQTLDRLLAFTESAVSADPEILRSSCYQGGCQLSIIRKGQVAFRFLDDPKIHVFDPRGTLQRLELRANRYFSRWGFSHPGRNSQIALKEGTRRANMRSSWKDPVASCDGVDTPVGIGLGRWFGTDLDNRMAQLNASSPGLATGLSKTPYCPLDNSPEALTVHRAQCLGAE